MTDTPIITRVFPNFDSDVKDTETLSAEAAVPETKCERPVPKPRTIFTFPQSSVAQQENSSESDESLVEWKGRFCTRWVTRACYNRLLTPRPVPPRITPPDEATVLAMLRSYNRNNNSRDRARRQPRRQPPQVQSALRYHTPFQPSTSLIP
uniref:Uncharacterized protein n=1 Tax=Panagrolaimus sp. ES5 TaxID=591445 RepID=A0AC34F8B1_9BILA